MPNEHRADPTPPPHHGQGQGGGSKKESFSLRVSPALHPPERPSPRRADIADHGLGRETRERRVYKPTLLCTRKCFCFVFVWCPCMAVEGFLKKNQNASRPSEHPPPSQGQKNVKTFRWDRRLQIQNLFMVFKRVPRWR